MKTTRVELPNGNLLRIEGGDAQQIANLINNRLVHTGESEAPMEMPVLNFTKQPAHSTPEGEESALEIPVLNFR